MQASLYKPLNRLLRVKFDDELLADIEIDLIAGREGQTLPWSFSTSTSSQAGTSTRSLETRALLMTRSSFAFGWTATRSARTNAEGRNVHAAAVDRDVTMGHRLTSFLAGASEAQAEDDVVETGLEKSA